MTTANRHLTKASARRRGSDSGGSAAGIGDRKRTRAGLGLAPSPGRLSSRPEAHCPTPRGGGAKAAVFFHVLFGNLPGRCSAAVWKKLNSMALRRFCRCMGARGRAAPLWWTKPGWRAAAAFATTVGDIAPDSEASAATRDPSIHKRHRFESVDRVLFATLGWRKVV